MNFRRLIQRTSFRDLAYGLTGAILMGVTCFIAAIIYLDMPEFVFLIVIMHGFLAGFPFGSTAILDLLSYLGAV
jgi:hypothetical protein